MQLKDINKIINNSIILSSSARSGSTLIGKILGSCKTCEYFHEPKTLDYLCAKINKYEPLQFNNLFNSLLYEDMIIENLAGRNINMNKYDDTSIYNYKNKSLIKKKISKSHPKSETAIFSKKTISIIKLLFSSMKLNDFIKIKKDIRIVFLTRNPHDVISSLLKKKWFSNHNLIKHFNLFAYRDYNKVKIPYWYDKNGKTWFDMTEIERCFYYYNLIYSFKNHKNIIYVDYDDFTKKKSRQNLLFSKLNLIKTESTFKLLKNITIKKSIKIDYKIKKHYMFEKANNLYQEKIKHLD